MQTHFLKHQHITPCLSSLDSTERQVSFSTTITKKGGGGGGGEGGDELCPLTNCGSLANVWQNKKIKKDPQKRRRKKGWGLGWGLKLSCYRLSLEVWKMCGKIKDANFVVMDPLWKSGKCVAIFKLYQNTNFVHKLQTHCGSLANV